ncbi:hypothetical protein PtA15_7A731 [Puccinia triticina]|uniref:Uncharacterized protein n=1 Tax=Puccinia triticina TaxID=208348 RepID=A0ABY7CSQ3_9BASI|nr:uncharacterized protein PtA15_7A731 [Puccinia triticina]WAQ87002.1 hypothetical protein PtA15_7A731 [Puccinia triticina]
MASSIKQATAIVKRIAGIETQSEVGTEDPRVALQEEEDEVPDLNPPKKGKKGSTVKEAPRKITTRSASKAPEDALQQRNERNEKETEQGYAIPLSAANPEGTTDTPPIDQGRKKRDRPGPVLNPVKTEAVPAELTAADAVPPWKIQQTLVAMVERAMKAEAEGNSVMASRLYDIGAGLGRALPRTAQSSASPAQPQKPRALVPIPGLKVPVPPPNEIDLTDELEGKHLNQQRRASPESLKGPDKGNQGGQRQTQGGYKGSRYNPRHNDRDGGRDGGREGGRGRNY